MSGLEEVAAQKKKAIKPLNLQSVAYRKHDETHSILCS